MISISMTNSPYRIVSLKEQQQAIDLVKYIVVDESIHYIRLEWLLENKFEAFVFDKT